MFKVLLQKGQALFITEMCQIRKIPTTKKKESNSRWTAFRLNLNVIEQSMK